MSEEAAKPLTADEVLADLKTRGLVANDRRIRRKGRKGRFNARATRFPRKTITFYGDDSRLSNWEKSFVILHEEGHMTQRMNSPFVMAYLSLLYAIPIALVLWNGFVGEGASSEDWALIALVIIGSWALPRVFREPLMMDEVIADTYAGTNLSAVAPNLVEQDIREMFEETLGPPIEPGRLRRFALFLGADIHPGIRERAETVWEAFGKARSNGRVATPSPSSSVHELP